MVPRIRMLIRAYRKRWKSDRRGETELRLLPLLAKGGVAVDVGANKGVYTYFLSRLCDRVVAFEPNPRLAGTIGAYGLKNVEIRTKALSDVEGDATLHIPLSRAGRLQNNIASLEHADGDSEAVAVPVSSLDAERLTDVSFVKIDVEGHELSVLRGAEQTLRRDRPTLLVEVTDEITSPHAQEVFGLLEAWNYLVFQHHEGLLKHVSKLDPAEMKGRHRNYICFPTQS
ncbi:MAG: FkbM family methyltransferase [Pseudomonadota bacterium]